jgi:hypothetical protein
MSLSFKKSKTIFKYENSRIVDINDNPLYIDYTNYQKALSNKYRANKERELESCFNIETDSSAKKICNNIQTNAIEICCPRWNIIHEPKT